MDNDTQNIQQRTNSHQDTHRGQSQAQHVRDREADVEKAKKWRLVHLQRSKDEARSAEPTFGLSFRAKTPKETNGEAQRAEPMLWLW